MFWRYIDSGLLRIFFSSEHPDLILSQDPQCTVGAVTFALIVYRNSLPALIIGLVIGTTTQYIKCSLPRTVGAAEVSTVGV